MKVLLSKMLQYDKHAENARLALEYVLLYQKKSTLLVLTIVFAVFFSFFLFFFGVGGGQPLLYCSFQVCPLGGATTASKVCLHALVID